MTERPLVSIITPSLNQGRFIEQTIRSIRNQTYREFEHLVMDGGSTDETLEILRRHEGTYPMRWHSERDGGMYEAINSGMRLAGGDILAYINADDLYLPWALEVVVECFVRRPQADFVYGGVISVDDVTGRQHLLFQAPFDLDYIQRVGFLHQPGVFWRRRVLETEGPFDEALRYVADCDYWMKVGGRHQFFRVSEFVAVERNHDATLRRDQAERVWGELKSVRSRYVTMEGVHHRMASAWHNLRHAAWERAEWARFAFVSLVPAFRQVGPWFRLRDSGGTKVRWSLLPLRIFPYGSRVRPPMIRPSRYWLEPPAR